MQGFIYKLTAPNGKIYVGQTTNLPKRMAQYSWAGCRGQSYLYSAIVKYGWDNFTNEVIGVGYSQSELDLLEIQAIKDLRSTDHAVGYNIACGGGTVMTGRKHTAESRAKMSRAASNRTAEHKAKIGFASSNRSPASKAKFSATMLGRYKGALHRGARQVICITTGVTYGCIVDAALATGASRAHISSCCKGLRGSTGCLPGGARLRWRYVD